MKQVRVGDDVYRRLQEYADGRPLGKAIERLLEEAAAYRIVVESRQSSHDYTEVEAALRRAARLTGKIEPTRVPLDAIPPDAKKGVHERFIEVHTAGDTKRVDVCTCGAGERAKGRHNKYCPLRGK